MARRLVLLACSVAFGLGCASEEPLTSTRPADSGYTVTEVSVTDTGTAPVDSSADETMAADTGDDTGSAADSADETASDAPRD